MTFDVNGNPVGWDDYYSYSMTMTWKSQVLSNSGPRYEPTAKERDASTCLDYFFWAATDHSVIELLLIIHSIIFHCMNHDSPGK